MPPYLILGGKNMSDSNIQIKSKSLYTISVNGIEDLIKLDLTDMSLPAKFLDMLQKVELKQKDYDDKITEIQAREDKIIYGSLSQNNLDCLNALNDMCNELRKEVDKFLGKGVCEAIFGEVNTYSMFEDLFEAIQPELEKAFKKGNMTLENMKKAVVDKYKPQESVLK